MQSRHVAGDLTATVSYKRCSMAPGRTLLPQSQRSRKLLKEVIIPVSWLFMFRHRSAWHGVERCSYLQANAYKHDSFCLLSRTVCLVSKKSGTHLSLLFYFCFLLSWWPCWKILEQLYNYQEQTSASYLKIKLMACWKPWRNLKVVFKIEI